MSKNVYLFLIIIIFLGGCATEPPKPQFVISQDQSLQSPPADKAQVVFLQPINKIQGLYPVGIFEIEGEQRTHLATTGAYSKVALLFTPGKHILMANHSGMISHFLEANVEAGKRYYVLVRFIYGNGFQLRPLRATAASDYSVVSKDFPKWVSETKFVEKTTDSDLMFQNAKAAVDKTQAKGWSVWLAKTPQERAELTLNKEDAVKE